MLNCVNYQHIDYTKMYPFWKKEVLLQAVINLFAPKSELGYTEQATTLTIATAEKEQ